MLKFDYFTIVVVHDRSLRASLPFSCEHNLLSFPKHGISWYDDDPSQFSDTFDDRVCMNQS